MKLVFTDFSSIFLFFFPNLLPLCSSNLLVDIFAKHIQQICPLKMIWVARLRTPEGLCFRLHLESTNLHCKKKKKRTKEICMNQKTKPKAQKSPKVTLSCP